LFHQGYNLTKFLKSSKNGTSILLSEVINSNFDIRNNWANSCNAVVNVIKTFSLNSS
jgi:hypothetical protein